MGKKSGAIQCIAYLIAIVCLIFQAILLNSEGFTRIDKLDKKEDRGVYLIWKQEAVPREDIETFLVADGFIFLFYDAAGIVNVYSVDGTFQYGVQVYTTTNGCGAMAYEDGTLYIESRLNVRYVFEKGICRQVIAFTSGVNDDEYHLLDYHFHVPSNTEWEGVEYVLSGDQSQVIRINKDSSKSVIVDLPKRNPYVYTLSFIWGLAPLVAYRAKKSSETDYKPERLGD